MFISLILLEYWWQKKANFDGDLKCSNIQSILIIK